MQPMPSPRPRLPFFRVVSSRTSPDTRKHRKKVSSRTPLRITAPRWPILGCGRLCTPVSAIPRQPWLCTRLGGLFRAPPGLHQNCSELLLALWFGQRCCFRQRCGFRTPNRNSEIAKMFPAVQGSRSHWLPGSLCLRPCSQFQELPIRPFQPFELGSA